MCGVRTGPLGTRKGSAGRRLAEHHHALLTVLLLYVQSPDGEQLLALLLEAVL